MAVGNILNQATAFGIDVHIMGGFSRQKVRSYFKLSDDVMPVAIMAMGYFGENGQLPEELAERDKKRRKRKAFDEVILRNNHGAPHLSIK
jgi:nitroreductase